MEVFFDGVRRFGFYIPSKSSRDCADVRFERLAFRVLWVAVHIRSGTSAD